MNLEGKAWAHGWKVLPSPTPTYIPHITYSTAYGLLLWQQLHPHNIYTEQFCVKLQLQT